MRPSAQKHYKQTNFICSQIADSTTSKVTAQPVTQLTGSVTVTNFYAHAPEFPAVVEESNETGTKPIKSNNNRTCAI
eukprot:1845247-Amphidinium_carterae.1